MTYTGIAPTPPRVWELWPAVQARLATATLTTILGGANRIQLETDTPTQFGTESQAWGRVVIAPVRRFYGEPSEEVGRRRVVPFLVRSEIHSPGSGYQPAIPLEAAQSEVFARLHGWLPTGLTRARVVEQLWRETPPQSLPLWDGDSGLWFLSSEYRAILAPA